MTSKRSTVLPAHTIRHRADKKLAQLPNVQATAYGVKRTAGALTDEPCYVVYVSHKVPGKQLQKDQHIPETVRRSGISLPTDVVEVGRWQRQEAFAVTDGIHQGTAGCFARQDSQAFYALSCAHALKGADGIWSTRDTIELWNTKVGKWISVGLSDYMVESAGRGEDLNFGLLDAGLVLIQEKHLHRHVRLLPALDVFRPQSADDIRSLLHQPVSAVSAVTDRRLSGIITGVWMHNVDDRGHRADIVIEATTREGLTIRGDSGLIWRTDNGEAVAMHVLGAEFGPSGASHLTIGTFLFRVEKDLDVKLLG